MDSLKVYCKNRIFNLKNNESRAQFALELYNFASVLDTEDENEDIEKWVRELKVKFDCFSKEHKMSMFTGSKTTGRATTGIECDSGGAMEQEEQLEARGYIVVPDVFETDGGTWKSLTKLPKHIRIVYHQDDPNKIELIAKAIREGSREPSIFDFLLMTGSQSPHVISPIETVTSATGNWVTLPKMLSISQQIMEQAGVGTRAQLGLGLIKGLAYLHEHNIAHRDIKPDNLVCDSNFRLKIIDFDIALKVQDENTMTDKDSGTKGWTAPEMGSRKQDKPTPMYSPIRADRWSCGRVLRLHIKVWKGDTRLDTLLARFAFLLMARNPRARRRFWNGMSGRQKNQKRNAKKPRL
ncbi:kinase-like domain-containing protein, partial [Lactarius quietus]